LEGKRPSARTEKLESPTEPHAAASIPPIIVRSTERDSTRKGRIFVNKTRRKTMTYNKPEVVNLGSALGVIQGNGKGSTHNDNNTDELPIATSTAYESDE
jgi:hypothetical protein